MTYSYTFTWRRSRSGHILINECPAIDGWLKHMLSLPDWNFFIALQYDYSIGHNPNHNL